MLVKSIRATVDWLKNKPLPTLTSNLLPAKVISLSTKPSVVTGSMSAELIVGLALLSKVNIIESRKAGANEEKGAELAKPISIKSFPALIDKSATGMPTGLITGIALACGISIPGSLTV